MDIGSILLGVALLLVVAFVVARPLLDRTGLHEHEPGPADELLGEHERVLAALRDLDFDHAMGKLVEDDYAAQRAALLAQGAAVLKQLDQVAPGATAPTAARPADEGVEAEIERAVARRRARPAAPTSPAAPSASGDADSVDAEIEARVAERRQAAVPPARFCAQCGHGVGPNDRFCGACGAPLAAASEMRPAKAKR